MTTPNSRQGETSTAASSDRSTARPHEVQPLTLGTAGHIDHGKTALVGLLTGKNTDRLPEEQERGISIELGYAELALPSGTRLSIVDVPGHERFVRTMVAGATGIDLFLLVIAADDGVMPQTMEHLGIIDLLAVQTGVVALTKADLVDEELLELARDDVQELLARTPYAGVEIVAVSARDGRGKAELLAALDRAAARLHSQRRGGPARLPVDRVFPLKGIGTVVTGTLWQGQVRAGDTLVVEPGARSTTVRSVQVHDHEADMVAAGSRVGLNLRGLSRDDVRRGDWLVAPELAGRACRRFDAWVRVLPGGRPLRSGDRVRLHHGTAQFVARVTPLEAREITPGSEAAAIVWVDHDTAVQPRDRFILRSLSPVSTVGGGQVLAITGRRWRNQHRHAAFLRALMIGDVRRAALELASDTLRGGAGRADLTQLGCSAEEADTALAACEKSGDLESLPLGDEPTASKGRAELGRWFVPGVIEGLRAALLTGAREHAERQPDRPFSAVSELAALVPELPVGDVEALLRSLQTDGELIAGEGGYAPAGAGVLSDALEQLAAALMTRLAHDPLAPPTLAVLASELSRSPREIAQVLDALGRRGDVVRADKDLWFTSAAVTTAREALLAALTADGDVSLAGYRDRVGCGRRNAQALLELFDKEGLTLRRGDVRVARRKR